MFGVLNARLFRNLVPNRKNKEAEWSAQNLRHVRYSGCCKQRNFVTSHTIPVSATDCYDGNIWNLLYIVRANKVISAGHLSLYVKYFYIQYDSQIYKVVSIWTPKAEEIGSIFWYIFDRATKRSGQYSFIRLIFIYGIIWYNIEALNLIVFMQHYSQTSRFGRC